MKYSDELIKKHQQYWERNYGEKLTEGTANEYLDSFTNLFSVIGNDSVSREVK